MGQSNTQFRPNVERANLKLKLLLIELEFICKVYGVGKIINFLKQFTELDLEFSRSYG